MADVRACRRDRPADNRPVPPPGWDGGPDRGRARTSAPVPCRQASGQGYRGASSARACPPVAFGRAYGRATFARAWRRGAFGRSSGRRGTCRAAWASGRLGRRALTGRAYRGDRHDPADRADRPGVPTGERTSGVRARANQADRGVDASDARRHRPGRPTRHRRHPIRRPGRHRHPARAPSWDTRREHDRPSSDNRPCPLGRVRRPSSDNRLCRPSGFARASSSDSRPCPLGRVRHPSSGNHPCRPSGFARASSSGNHPCPLGRVRRPSSDSHPDRREHDRPSSDSRLCDRRPGSGPSSGGRRGAAGLRRRSRDGRVARRDSSASAPGRGGR
jgi:hypothetical protein